MSYISRLLAALFSLAISLLRLGITSVKTTPRPADAEVDGAVMNSGSIVQLIGQLAVNGAPSFGNWGLSVSPATLAADTYTGAEMVAGIIQRNSTGSLTDSTDTATNIVNAIPGAVVGQTFPCLIANMGSGVLTVAAGTGVTLGGTTTLSRFSIRLFLGTVTGSAAVTFTNCFQFSNASLNG